MPKWHLWRGVVVPRYALGRTSSKEFCRNDDRCAGHVSCGRNLHALRSLGFGWSSRLAWCGGIGARRPGYPESWPPTRPEHHPGVGRLRLGFPSQPLGPLRSKPIRLLPVPAILGKRLRLSATLGRLLWRRWLLSVLAQPVLVRILTGKFSV
jgi:hypothetical protein